MSTAARSANISSHCSAAGGWWLIGIGALDAHVHFGANRTGLLGIDPERPRTAAWLKPGVLREGFPSVTKEELYDPDGSIYERTVYVHEVIIGVGRPLRRLDQPICGTAFYKSTAYNVGKRFYHEQLKTTEALIGGKRVRNMTLALWEKSSEIAHGRNQCAWMAPLSRKLGVVGEPNGPSLAETTYAKSLWDAFKQGRPWMSEPLPAIAASPPTEAPRIRPRSAGRPSPTYARGPTPGSRTRRRSRGMSTTATPAVRTAWNKGRRDNALNVLIDAKAIRQDLVQTGRGAIQKWAVNPDLGEKIRDS